MEKRKSNATISTKRSLYSLYIFTYLMITIQRSVAYKSGCRGGYCFILSENDELKTQDEAHQWCFNNGSQLIEIQNDDIQAALTDFISNQSVFSIMTNGVRRSIPWTRLSGNNTRRIAIYEQNDVTYSYGYLKSTGSVFDVYASAPIVYRQGYICSGGQINCTMAGAALIDGQCYMSNIEWLQWYSARNKCLNIGGDLASFDSITTSSGFNALNDSWLNPSTEYWIGFKRESWTWNGTGDDVRYSEWSSGHPMKYVYEPYGSSDCLCLASSDNYQWTECRCNDPLQFLCISGSTTAAISEREHDTTSLTRDTLASSITSEQNDLRIYLGVGIGVGLGLIIIIVIISVIIILFRRRGCPRIPTKNESVDYEANPRNINASHEIGSNNQRIYEGLSEGSNSKEHTYQSLSPPNHRNAAGTRNVKS